MTSKKNDFTLISAHTQALLHIMADLQAVLYPADVATSSADPALALWDTGKAVGSTSLRIPKHWRQVSCQSLLMRV